MQRIKTMWMSVIFLFLTSPLLHAQQQPQPKPESFAQSMMGSIYFPMALVLLIFYFLLIRPQNKQQKERTDMLSNIQKGDLVITTSGIYAKVVGVTDQILSLEIADNVKIKVEREAVAKLNNNNTKAS